MANDEKIVNGGTSGGPEGSSFISAGGKGGNNIDSTYSDFFQETGDGNISIGPKAQKSGIEITTTILSYIVPIAIVLSLFGSFHVYIRNGGGATNIKEKYSFLCNYLNYGVNLEEGEKDCRPIGEITEFYKKNTTELEEKIITKLSEYIPIKITKNLLITSPERAFVIDTYDKKVPVEKIMEQFEVVRRASRGSDGDNIICNGITIEGAGILSTQCTIYGGALGDNNDTGGLGSARIEALNFTAELSNTTKSQFILLNPPKSMSMEIIENSARTGGYGSRTSLSIQAQYVPFDKKP